MRTWAPSRASSHAVARPMPLFAPVMRTILPCMASGIRRPAYRREDVDEIAVGIPEQHRAAAPGQVGGCLDPVTDLVLQPLVLGVDVVDLEVEDRGPVRGRLGDVL